MIRVVRAHGYGQRFILRADEVLTAFVELQKSIADPIRGIGKGDTRVCGEYDLVMAEQKCASGKKLTVFVEVPTALKANCLDAFYSRKSSLDSYVWTIAPPRIQYPDGCVVRTPA